MPAGRRDYGRADKTRPWRCRPAALPPSHAAGLGRPDQRLEKWHRSARRRARVPRRQTARPPPALRTGRGLVPPPGPAQEEAYETGGEPGTLRAERGWGCICPGVALAA